MQQQILTNLKRNEEAEEIQKSINNDQEKENKFFSAEIEKCKRELKLKLVYKDRVELLEIIDQCALIVDF